MPPTSKAQTRRERLRAWFAGKSLPEKEKSYFSQLLNEKAPAPFGEKAARRIEGDYGMLEGYLDQAASTTPAKSQDSPLLLEDYALLLEEDQQRIKSEIHRLAEIARAYQRKFGANHATDARVAKHLPPAPTTQKETK